MTFFRLIARSIWSPAHYRAMPRKGFGGALGYFLTLALCLTLIRTLAGAVNLAPLTSDGLQPVVTGLAAQFPRDLVITIQGGKVETNARQPFAIPLTDTTGMRTPGEIQNLLVIDTRTPYSAERFRGFRSLAWLSADTLYLRDEAGTRIRAIDLSQYDGVRLDRPTVDGLVRQLLPWLNWLLPLAIAGMLLGFFILYIVRLVYVALLALLIWLGARLISLPWGFGSAYKAGLFGMTLALLLETLVSVSAQWTGIRGFPFMFTLVTVLALLVNLTAARNLSPFPDELSDELVVAPTTRPATAYRVDTAPAGPVPERKDPAPVRDPRPKRRPPPEPGAAPSPSYRPRL
jgi:hypothetical protein